MIFVPWFFVQKPARLHLTEPAGVWLIKRSRSLAEFFAKALKLILKKDMQSPVIEPDGKICGHARVCAPPKFKIDEERMIKAERFSQGLCLCLRQTVVSVRIIFRREATP